MQRKAKAVCRAGLTAVILSSPLMTACDPVSLTAASLAAGTGISHTLGGIVSRTFTAPIKSVEHANTRALRDMGIEIVSRETNENGERVVSAQANDREIEILLEPLSTRTTRIRARAMEGLFHDAATATEIILQTGDVIVIPDRMFTVKVVGEVGWPTSLVYQEGKNIDWYVKNAGGYLKKSDKKRARVVWPNGRSLPNKGGHEVVAGSTIIVPVPLHGWRFFRRGYNQADLVARRLGRDLGLRIDAGLLQRRRQTPAQTGLDAVQRGTVRVGGAAGPASPARALASRAPVPGSGSRIT